VLITDLSTPQVLVDRSRLVANIARTQSAVTSVHLRLRPHAKTHKSPVIAQWQMNQGGVGICCAKVGEAEIFADFGIPDIRLAYPVSPANADRLLRLMDRARVSIAVDHLAIARQWSDLMQHAGRRLDVLVKVDVGFHRCGIDPKPPGSTRFIRQVAALPGLKVKGLMSYTGQAYSATSDSDLAQMVEAEARTLRIITENAEEAGVAIEEVSVGSTPTFRFNLQQRGVTELRAGSYIYGDRTQVAFGAMSLEDCALTVVATVVSMPAKDRLVLDCGSKTLGLDPVRGFGVNRGYGIICATMETERPDENLLIDQLSEEYAVVKVVGRPTDLGPGDKVRILPNHACVVSNLTDCIHLVEGQDVVETLPVAARGKVT